VPLAAEPGPEAARLRERVDVVFPLVHGTFGEDGCLQGLLELAEVPYVGSNVLASAVGMDKIVMKAVFQAYGLPVVPFASVARADWEQDPTPVLGRLEAEIGYPCFVKPANLGSSVGISKARGREQLADGLALAAEFSSRLIVEAGREVRELACGVLGNDRPAASVVGEVIPNREFYDYEAKYHDPQTRFMIPADISPEAQAEVQALAVRAFQAIGASGLARVDFFLDRADGRLWVNEINTIPGFTAMSVYPRLWAASGVPYPELIHRLIQLARERHRDQARNRTRYGL
jgi:D-alanine-D-alanine ligase